MKKIIFLAISIQFLVFVAMYLGYSYAHAQEVKMTASVEENECNKCVKLYCQ